MQSGHKLFDVVKSHFPNLQQDLQVQPRRKQNDQPIVGVYTPEKMPCQGKEKSNYK
jgi:hypothetical protein